MGHLYGAQWLASLLFRGKFDQHATRFRSLIEMATTYLNVLNQEDLSPVLDLSSRLQLRSEDGNKFW